MRADIPWQARHTVERLRARLPATLAATYLYGSFVEGGLRAGSDLDLLCVLVRPLREHERARITTDLLALSAPPGHAAVRPLEVTCVVGSQVVPWRHPARREYQFGEWLRPELLAGVPAQPVSDPDLALLVTQARAKGIALHGPPPETLLPAVPARDVHAAILAMLPEVVSHLEGEELHALLTLARMWVTLDSGDIVSKDAAAARVLAWLPAAHRPALARARAIHLGEDAGDWAGWGPRVHACAHAMAAGALRAC